MEVYIPDRKSVVQGVTGVQTCALPISSSSYSIKTFALMNMCKGFDRFQSRPWMTRIQAYGGIYTRSEERRAGSDWSSDVCSSDLIIQLFYQNLCTYEYVQRF